MIQIPINVIFESAGALKRPKANIKHCKNRMEKLVFLGGEDHNELNLSGILGNVGHDDKKSEEFLKSLYHHDQKIEKFLR